MQTFITAASAPIFKNIREQSRQRLGDFIREKSLGICSILVRNAEASLVRADYYESRQFIAREAAERLELGKTEVTLLHSSNNYQDQFAIWNRAHCCLIFCKLLFQL